MKMAVQPPLLELRNLYVNFDTMAGVAQGLRGVSLTIDRGETLALVGESGSGKSVTAQAIVGLIEAPGRIASGDILWDGQSILGPKGKSLAKSIRGNKLSMVFQNPMTSLNPLMTIGDQIQEVVLRHLGVSRKEARQRAIDLLDMVGVTMPESRLVQLPHEFSGGMRQRVMIAIAIACEPDLLVADEPTTALDVTVQAQILDLLEDIQNRMNLAVLLITHDLGVVAETCHRVAVMYGGQIMEDAPVERIFNQPAHPYTRGLIRATPRVDQINERLWSIDGMPPNLLDPPPGCPFMPRCQDAMPQCQDTPPSIQTGPNAIAACWNTQKFSASEPSHVRTL
jgi:peptide/nickel transport system ATP-binding protein